MSSSFCRSARLQLQMPTLHIPPFAPLNCDGAHVLLSRPFYFPALFTFPPFLLSRPFYFPALFFALKHFTQIWLETGGGGHGMADLWPLRDALNFQGFEPILCFLQSA
jgi:hypothetical protein